MQRLAGGIRLARDIAGATDRWSVTDLTRLVERHRLGDGARRAGCPDQIRLLAEAYEALQMEQKEREGHAAS